MRNIRQHVTELAENCCRRWLVCSALFVDNAGVVSPIDESQDVWSLEQMHHNW